MCIKKQTIQNLIYFLAKKTKKKCKFFRRYIQICTVYPDELIIMMENFQNKVRKKQIPSYLNFISLL